MARHPATGATDGRLCFRTSVYQQRRHGGKTRAGRREAPRSGRVKPSVSISPPHRAPIALPRLNAIFCPPRPAVRRLWRFAAGFAAAQSANRPAQQINAKVSDAVLYPLKKKSAMRESTTRSVTTAMRSGVYLPERVCRLTDCSTPSPARTSASINARARSRKPEMYIINGLDIAEPQQKRLHCRTSWRRK